MIGIYTNLQDNDKASLYHKYLYFNVFYSRTILRVSFKNLVNIDKSNVSPGVRPAHVEITLFLRVANDTATSACKVAVSIPPGSPIDLK